MRHRIARLLRRAANRLDPPRITNTTCRVTSSSAALQVTPTGTGSFTDTHWRTA